MMLPGNDLDLADTIVIDRDGPTPEPGKLFVDSTNNKPIRGGRKKKP